MLEICILIVAVCALLLANSTRNKYKELENKYHTVLNIINDDRCISKILEEKKNQQKQLVEGLTYSHDELNIIRKTALERITSFNNHYIDWKTFSGSVPAPSVFIIKDTDGIFIFYKKDLVWQIYSKSNTLEKYAGLEGDNRKCSVIIDNLELNEILLNLTNKPEIEEII